MTRLILFAIFAWSLFAFFQGVGQASLDDAYCHITTRALSVAPIDRLSRANPVYEMGYWFYSTPGCAAWVEAHRK